MHYNDPLGLPIGVLGLDIVIAITAGLTFVHAAQRGYSQILLYFALFLVALFVEMASVNNGHVRTHCHHEASLMITECSSLNSVLFYLPWFYTSIHSSLRLKLPWWAFPACVGLLEGSFGVGYELQGPSMGWWRYTSDDVANGALRERIFGMPIMAAYFHPAMGYGVAAAALAVGYFKKPSLFKGVLMVVLSPLAALMFDIPVRLLTHLQVTKYTSVPCLLFTLFVLPVLAATTGRTGPTSPDTKPAYLRFTDTKQDYLLDTKQDYLLFTIPLIWHAHHLAARFWDPLAGKGEVEYSPDLYAINCLTALASMTLHYFIDLRSQNHAKAD